MSKAYLNSTTMMDGNILLYQRPGNLKGSWHMRILRPRDGRAKGPGGYYEKSSRTNNLGQAASMAEDIYYDLRSNAKHGIFEDDLSFNELYRKWMASIGSRKTKTRQDAVKRTMRLYFLPFFGKTNVRDITSKLVTDYWEFRLTYWDPDGPGHKLNSTVTRFSEKPSGSTLQAEQYDFGAILKWGITQGYLQTVPELTQPIPVASSKDTARPAFSEKQFNKIQGWLNSQRLKKMDKTMMSYSRRMFANWVLASLATGARPHELFLMRWKHVYIKGHIKDGKKYTYVDILENTKTGKRDLVPLEIFDDAINDILKFSKHIGPDDYVFTNWRGEPVTRGYGRRFDEMLQALDSKKMNMITDDRGVRFVPYSTRHSYITNLLLANVPAARVAKNCGTSETKIEQNYDHTINRNFADQLTVTDTNKTKYAKRKSTKQNQPDNVIKLPAAR